MSLKIATIELDTYLKKQSDFTDNRIESSQESYKFAWSSKHKENSSKLSKCIYRNLITISIEYRKVYYMDK